MAFSFSQSIDLPEDVQDILTRYTEHLHKHWGENLQGLILFGSAARGDFLLGRSNINLLAVISDLSVRVLSHAGKIHQEWGKHQIIAPLLMTEKELVQTRSLFPLEFLQMAQNHVLLIGQDPFGKSPVDTVRLSWQCEHELMANLIRVRQRFIEGEGRNEAIHSLLILSITAVLPCLRGLLYCLGQPSQDQDQHILESLMTTVQFDPTVFLNILNIKRGLSSPGSFEWEKTYTRYLQNLEQFIERVRDIRQEGRL